MRILVTGSAGFIGFHVAKRLLATGHSVAGIDGMTPYYDVRLKQDRHAKLCNFETFRPYAMMLEDGEGLMRVADAFLPDLIVHLAAQAGVRYSIENPRSYIDSNLVGSFNLLEVARKVQPAHLLIASTSSVYGSNTEMPFSELDKADHPLTLYAATKKATEAMAHSYSYLWNVPTTMFRFFTAYGPWGRPDMALFKFVDAILNGQPIDVYGHGKMKRDFTYIDDLVEGIVRLIACPPVMGMPVMDRGVEDTLAPEAPFRIVNIAGGHTVALLDFIECIETRLGRKAIRNMLPMQTGDVPASLGDHRLLEALTGFRPATSIYQGVSQFVDWFESYYSRQT
jgi:UDP-glucuronate 4-epimerase